MAAIGVRVARNRSEVARDGNVFSLASKLWEWIVVGRQYLTSRQKFGLGMPCELLRCECTVNHLFWEVLCNFIRHIERQVWGIFVAFVGNERDGEVECEGSCVEGPPNPIDVERPVKGNGGGRRGNDGPPGAATWKGESGGSNKNIRTSSKTGWHPIVKTETKHRTKKIKTTKMITNCHGKIFLTQNAKKATQGGTKDRSIKKGLFFWLSV